MEEHLFGRYAVENGHIAVVRKVLDTGNAEPDSRDC
jgi:hypothetical protein